MQVTHSSPSASRSAPTIGDPEEPDPPSPLAEALAAIGDRWTLLVIATLLDGPRRFGDVRVELPGIAPNVLTHRLRHLEREGLVVAQPYSQRPPRFVYELTGAGRGLASALRMLSDWGARHREGVEAPRHAACGTPVESRWYCPTCERAVDDDEATRLDFA